MTAIGCTGKLPKKEDARNLKLARYLSGSIPRPGLTKAWSEAVDVWGVFGNNIVGDCTCAALAHAVQCWSANDGHPMTPKTSEVLAAYSKISGYDPTRPETDRGAYMLDACKLMLGDGIGGHTAEAFAEIDPDDPTTLMSGIDLFGVIYCGLRLPLSAKHESIWADTSGAAGGWGGHAVCLLNRTPYTWTCITWGRVQQMTHQFFDRYCDENYVLVSPDWTGPDDLSPSLCDTAQLIADARALRRV